jgi:hypothetical protein
MFNRFASHCAPLAVLAALSLAPSVSNAQQGRPTVSAFIEDAGPRFTSNAFFSEKDARSDLFVSPTTGIGVSGLFAPGLAYSFSAAMVNSRYQKFSVLDEDIAALSARVAYTSGAWTLAAGYSPKWVYTRGFDALSAELHDWTASLKGVFTWNGVSVAPILSARRRFSDVDVIEATRLGLGVELGWKTSDRSILKVAPGLAYTIYDTSPVSGTDRRDVWTGVTFDHIWSLTPSVDLVLSAALEYSDSTVAGRSWKQFSIGPSLNLATKF